MKKKIYLLSLIEQLKYLINICLLMYIICVLWIYFFNEEFITAIIDINTDYTSKLPWFENLEQPKLFNIYNEIDHYNIMEYDIYIDYYIIFNNNHFTSLYKKINIVILICIYIPLVLYEWIVYINNSLYKNEKKKINWLLFSILWTTILLSVFNYPFYFSTQYFIQENPYIYNIYEWHETQILHNTIQLQVALNTFYFISIWIIIYNYFYIKIKQLTINSYIIILIIINIYTYTDVSMLIKSIIILILLSELILVLKKIQLIIFKK